MKQKLKQKKLETKKSFAFFVRLFLSGFFCQVRFLFQVCQDFKSTTKSYKNEVFFAKQFFYFIIALQKLKPDKKCKPFFVSVSVFV
jgi:hypothetical protein